jgi:2-(1,2-epoxy-1,2-dihydrophenyl)acetyl-CoA isomerase
MPAIEPMVTFEVRHGAGWITFNQPDKGNPFNLASVAALSEAVAQAQAADVGVVVLAAAGRSFSVGGDLAAFNDAPDPSAYLHELADALHREVAILMDLDAIVVSVVQGTAAGAGVAFAACADIVLAAEAARFTMAYTKVGLSPDGGSSLMTSSIGLHRTLYLALLNPLVTAREALAMGFVTQVHPDDELEGAVDKVVSQLVSGSRRALVSAKRLIRQQAAPSPVEALHRETLAMAESAGSPDGREGVSAFLEKRPPVFGASDR